MMKGVVGEGESATHILEVKSELCPTSISEKNNATKRISFLRKKGSKININ